MKRLLKAILWIVCYGGACWFGIKAKLGFDILSGNHWKLLFDKSIYSHWPTDLAAKKLVCKVLLAFIVVGIIGLSVVTRQKKRRIPVIKEELPPDKENFRPAMMASQGRMTAPTPAPTPNGSSNNVQPAFDTKNTNSIADAIRKITDITDDFEVSVFPHVKLENTFTQLVVSDDSSALLLKILPQSGTWKVEKTEKVEESLWTLGEEQPKKLLKEILESVAVLTRLEPEAHSIAVVVMTDGNIENAAEVANYLEQNGVRIVALNNQEMPEISTWKNLLSEFYLPKEEAQNETDDTSQNM